MQTQFHTQNQSDPQSKLQNPRPKVECAATTRHGLPCQGAPLEHSPYCAFHDPDHAAAVAAGRSRGGAAPRRVRRVPRLLDYRQVAELTGELFVEALNHANPADPGSLRAISQLARVLLHAVGRPKDSYVPPGDDAEPVADAPHLLRVYPPLTRAVEALLAAETQPRPPAPARHSPAPGFERHRDYTFQPGCPAEVDERHAWLDAPSPAPWEERAEAASAEDPASTPGTTPSPTVGACVFPAAEPAPWNEPLPEQGAEQCSVQGPEQGAEQGMDREWTGQLATDDHASADPPPAADRLAPMDPASAPARGPAFAPPRALVYIRRQPRDPFR